ncbi:MAG: HD domain-containing protein [Bacteroidales bacterium]|nr:HD domain-containing protein [Bacteroidales bacterium]
MDPLIFKIIEEFYPPGSLRNRIYVPHCQAVTTLALKIALSNPGLNADEQYIQFGGMLHDIGIFYTETPDFGCYGRLPYLAHGYMGRELLEKKGLKDIAPVCERHIGVGITIEEIKQNNLPLPVRDMVPQTIEEKIICYADKFFSKSASNLSQPKPLDKVKRSIRKYGDTKWDVFEEMMNLFGTESVYGK